MSKNSSRAIIIGRYDFKENDSLVLLYSEKFGKLKLIAKGAKKFNSKLAAHIEPVTLSKILVVPSRSNFDYLASSSSIYLFKNLKEDWEKLKLLGEIMQIFNKSVKYGEADYKMFDWLLLWLKNLIRVSSDESEKMKAIFMIRFFKIIGYDLSLENCSSCFKKNYKNKYYFDFKQANLICSNCLNSSSNYYELSNNCLKLFNFIQNNEKTVIAKKSMIKELNHFLFKFWQFQDL